MTDVQPSDSMKNLVMFIIVLAILGAIVALTWYFAVDLPMQHAAITTPANGCWGPTCH